MTDPRISFVESLSQGGSDEIMGVLKNTTIRIRLTRETLATLAAQALVYQAVSLIAKLFDQVVVDADRNVHAHDNAPFVGPFVPALEKELGRSMYASDVDGNGAIFTVAIGTLAGAADLYVGSTAWTAHISVSARLGVEESDITLGALASGALTAAEVFKQLFGARLTGAVPLATSGPASLALNLLDYAADARTAPPGDTEMKPLDVTLFGAGSVGCGVANALLFCPSIIDKLTIVDNGSFDERNPFKYALLDVATAERKERKAKWLAEKLRAMTRNRFNVAHSYATAYDYVAGLDPDYRIPIAISAVDTFLSRLEIQDTLPGRIINAGVAGTTVEVSVHGFGVTACLGCVALGQELENWSADVIATAVGLPSERVAELIEGNLGMTIENIRTIEASLTARGENVADIESFVGQPILSFYNRLFYAETVVQTDAGEPVRVTTAFVSAFAGVLIVAELAKLSNPSISASGRPNSYRQELLGVPAEARFNYERDERSWCLCHSGFRLATYRENYGALS